MTTTIASALVNNYLSATIIMFDDWRVLLSSIGAAIYMHIHCATASLSGLMPLCMHTCCLADACSSTHEHAYTHTHTLTYILYIHACMHACINACMHTPSPFALALAVSLSYLHLRTNLPTRLAACLPACIPAYRKPYSPQPTSNTPKRNPSVAARITRIEFWDVFY